MRLNVLEVKKCMLDQDLAARDVAADLGISIQAFYDWMRGESMPTYDNLDALMHLLDVTPNDLLISDDKENER